MDELHGIGTETNILDSPAIIKEWDLPENIILISGDGHTWIALDYREYSENPPVILIDEDVAGVQTLAANFEDFINGLTVDEPMDWVDYILYEASLLDETTKLAIAAEVRNGRTNEEIRVEIEKVIATGKTKEIEAYFSQFIQLYDGELELYMMERIFDHPHDSIREIVAEHLAACVIRGEAEFSLKITEDLLVAMKEKESNAHICYFIELALEKIRKGE